jgi:lipopolysaccharide export system permease protein
MNIPIPDMVLQRRDSEFRGDREQNVQMMQAEIKNNFKLIHKREENLNIYIDQQIVRYFPVAKPDLPETKTNEAQIIFLDSLKTTTRFRANLDKQLRINGNILRRITSEIDVNNSYLLSNNKLSVEIHKKFSIPFACIVFVFIGAPLGILAHRGNLAVGGGISLIFFIIYWIFLIGGEELADRDMLSPFLSMWLANFIVGGFGLYLLIKTVKEISFIYFISLGKLVPKRFT